MSRGHPGLLDHLEQVAATRVYDAPACSTPPRAEGPTEEHPQTASDRVCSAPGGTPCSGLAVLARAINWAVLRACERRDSATLRDYVGPFRPRALRQDRCDPATFRGGIREQRESLRARLPGRNAERFGMCPAVVPVRTSLALPGRYAPVRWQIWQRMTGRCVTVTGKRPALEVTCPHVGGHLGHLPGGPAHAASRTPRAGPWWTAVMRVSSAASAGRSLSRRARRAR